MTAGILRDMIKTRDSVVWDSMISDPVVQGSVMQDSTLQDSMEWLQVKSDRNHKNIGYR